MNMNNLSMDDLSMDDRQYVRLKVYWAENRNECSLNKDFVDIVLKELSDRGLNFIVARPANSLGMVYIRRVK